MKTHPQCAFCVTPLTSTWNGSRAVGVTSFIHSAAAVVRRTNVHVTGATVPTTRRVHQRVDRFHRPVAIFNNGTGNDGNRPEERFTKQSIEMVGNAVRFFQSPPGQAVLWFGLVWLVLTGRIGFIFDSFLVLFGLFTIAPVLAVLTFRWWLSRKLVEGTCPSCGATVTGIKGQTFPCNVCGNAVQVDGSGSFSVKDPTSATIDIDATEIKD